MILEDLDRKSITELSDEEALKIIIQVRNSRMTPTTASRKRSVRIAKAAKAATKVSPMDMFKSLSAEKQAAFIARLEDKRNEGNTTSDSKVSGD